jgi:TRAP transporter TAXI family solute receptor
MTFLHKRNLAALFVLLFIGFACQLMLPSATMAQNEKTEITIFTYPIGTFAYVHSYNLSEMINKKSSWLKTSVFACTTPTDGMMQMINMPKNSIVANASDGPAAIMGITPYDKPHPSIKYISSIFQVGNPMATLDSNLRTWADLKGKTISTTSPAGISTMLVKACMAGAGVQPNEYKLTYMSYQRGMESLKSGMVAAAAAGGLYYPKPRVFNPNPPTAEVLSTQPLYFLPITAADVEKVMKDNGYFGMKPLKVPAGNFKGSDQEVTAFTMSASYFCDESLDPKIVTEIVNIWHDNFEELKAGIPAIKNYSTEDMGNMMVPRGVCPSGCLKGFSRIQYCCQVSRP